jgi:hypothetical protein
MFVFQWRASRAPDLKTGQRRISSRRPKKFVGHGMNNGRDDPAVGEDNMIHNYIAVLVAAVGAWVAGAIWYGVLGNTWMGALEKTKDQMGGGKMPIVPMILSFVADVVMAYVLAAAIATRGPVNIKMGACTAAIMWLGFVLTTQVVNNAFAKRKVSLTIIDSGHWLLALLVAGIIIGAFG